MKPKLYIETSVVSYLTARLSKEPLVAAQQQVTKEWWDGQRAPFELYVSRTVLDEARAGNLEEARKRLQALVDLPVLIVTPQVETLARRFLRVGPLPEKAANDAIHIALAVVNQMNYLLTWNCKHIANPRMQPALLAICAALGHRLPVICTPEALMEESSHGE